MLELYLEKKIWKNFLPPPPKKNSLTELASYLSYRKAFQNPNNWPIFTTSCVKI